MGSMMQKAIGAALVCALFCFIRSGWTDSTAAEPSRVATAASVMGSGITQPPSEAPSAQVVMEKLARSPAVFIENHGQWEDETIRFALSSMGANVGLTDQGVRFQLFQRESLDVASACGGWPVTGRSPTRQSHYGDGTMPVTPEETEAAARGRGLTPEERSDEVSVPGRNQSARRMLEFEARFEDARRVVPEGEGRSEQVFHYRLGDPARWRENVPSWDALLYRNLYDGIDLRVTGKRTGIKFEFIVAPGADWHEIRVRYDGIEDLALRDDGALEIRPGEGWATLVDGAPYIYQEIDGQRHPVEGRFALVDSKTWRFEISGDIDPAHKLIIDPELEWSTYLGGSNEEWGTRIGVDSSGNIVVSGRTDSSGWVSGGFDTSFNGRSDAFIAKLSASGAHLWSTYLGGSNSDYGYGIAVDGSGNIAVTGYTYSSGWVSGGLDTTYNGGQDAFVAKLSPEGAHLWSTYLGGSDSDSGYGITVDGSGNIVVTGLTASSGWVSGGFDTTYNDGQDAFVAKLGPSGAHLWSTYLGGRNSDYGFGIAVDGSRNIVVAGWTQSSGWVSGGFDTTYNGGGGDAFVAKLSPQGAHLWSTYLGGSNWDYGMGIGVNGSENIVVTGTTGSIGWVSGGFDTTYDGGEYDAFVAKLSPQGAHLWSTYLGGTGSDWGTGIGVDRSGNIVVTGATESSGWVSGGFDTSFNGRSDAFVAKLSASGAHLWSTYLGGSSGDQGWGMAVDGSGNIVVTGLTQSSGWVSGGFDTTYNGGGDAFVAKIRDPLPTPTPTPTPSPTPSPTATPNPPELEWSTYLGGNNADWGDGIAVDGSGNIVVADGTWSIGWVSGGYDTTYNGGLSDAFVAKLSPSGAHLWSTYLGGSDKDYGFGIAVDSSGNIFVTGETESSGWVSGGFDTTYNGGFGDAFVAKLSPQGAHLWSTYLGGSDADGGFGIAVDGSGSIVVTGGTYSIDWVSGGFDTIYNGREDAFVAKLSSSGGHLWSTYLGGGLWDGGHGIAVGGSDVIVVTGFTESSGWVSGGFDTTYNWRRDAFVAKLSPSGAHLWSTYLGGGNLDSGYGIGVDGSDNIVVTGRTESSGWVSGGFDTTYDGSGDAFVVKLSPSGSHLWSTYLGGSYSDKGYCIAVDGSANIVVTGSTWSIGWVSGGFDTTYNGDRDAFVAKLSPQGAHVWSTYLGGSKWESGYGIAVDSSGNIVVTGETWSSGWVSGGFDTTYNGSGDAFVAKIRDWFPTPIVFDFVSHEEGWTTGGATTVFTPPDFAWKPDFLTMTSRTNTNTFGFWQSPHDALPADPDYLYRARFTVSTDLTAKWLIPQIRLSANSLNLQRYDVLSIESAGDGGASPSPSGTNYDLYFVPPANDIAAMLAFDLLNFNPDDAAVAELALDTVTVDRFALDALSTPTTVRDYTFDLTTDGWTTGGAPIVFSPPQYIHSSGALELRPTANDYMFGFWGNDPADITIEAEQLYRGIFEIRTDVTIPIAVPDIRLRFNIANLQASRTLGISGGNSPGTTNTTYDRLYFLPPVNCVGENLLVSVDMLKFSLEKTGSVTIDRAVIETLPLPTLP